MLKKLSLRNARRQFQNYLLYFITLTISVSLIFGFNCLIFSDSVQDGLQLSALAYVIPVASGLAVIILGWLISYMLNFMLKKRSLELGTYLLLGIEKKQISNMFLFENILIGTLAFFAGVLCGGLIYQVLLSFVSNLLGRTFVIRFDLSPKSFFLTFVCFFIMFLFSLGKSRRRIAKMKLYDLLYLDKQNEKALYSHSIFSFLLLILSAGSFFAAVFLIRSQALGSGADILAAIILIVVFLYSFYLAMASALSKFLQNNRRWKFKKERILLLRSFTAKTRSMGITLGTLSALLVIALFVINIGILLTTTLDFRSTLTPFDLTLTTRSSGADFANIRSFVTEQYDVADDHVYSIYESTANTFTARFGGVQVGYNHVSTNVSTDLDSCMKLSDYNKLRTMLGYPSVELDDNSYLIHCIYLIADDIRMYAESYGDLTVYGMPLSFSGIYSEHFDQYDGIPNGQNLLLILPDDKIPEEKHHVSKYTALFDPAFTYKQYKTLVNEFSLREIHSSIYSSTISDVPYISDADAYYIDSISAIRSSNGELYAIFTLPMFYVAFILSITVVTVLATQLLSDSVSFRKQFSLLSKLGMSRSSIDRSIFSYLFTFFLLPVIPALLISGFLAFSFADGFGMIGFVNNNQLWIKAGSALGIYAVLYLIYFTAVYTNYRRNILSKI